MGHPYIIYKLPATRRKYNVREASPILTIAADTCSICYRNYHIKDDPNDVNETPCIPLQLQPCKHIIGSECFLSMIQADMDTCQICRTKIQLLSDPFPPWLQTATSWSWYRLFADYTPGQALHDGKSHEFDTLSKRLFDRRFLAGDVARLWWFYMDCLSAWTRIIFIFWVIIRTTFALYEWFLGTPFVELLFLRALGIRLPESRLFALCVDFPIVALLWSLTTRWNASNGGSGVGPGVTLAISFIMARIFTLMFSMEEFALLLGMNWAAYASCTAGLIWYGIMGDSD